MRGIPACSRPQQTFINNTGSEISSITFSGGITAGWRYSLMAIAVSVISLCSRCLPAASRCRDRTPTNDKDRLESSGENLRRALLDFALRRKYSSTVPSAAGAAFSGLCSPAFGGVLPTALFQASRRSSLLRYRLHLPPAFDFQACYVFLQNLHSISRIPCISEASIGHDDMPLATLSTEIGVSRMIFFCVACAEASHICQQRRPRPRLRHQFQSYTPPAAPAHTG